ASDRYMENLLVKLLRDHAAAGGHALLLSATLGAGMRSRILGLPIPIRTASEVYPYPALTYENDCVAIAPSGSEKVVNIAPRSIIHAPAKIAALALDAAHRGAKVLVVRNTVRAAILTAQAIETLAGASSVLFQVEGRPTLHHGRFGPEDRRVLDAAVQQQIG